MVHRLVFSVLSTLLFAGLALAQQQAVETTEQPTQPTQSTAEEQQAQSAEVDSYVEALTTLIKNLDSTIQRREELNSQRKVMAQGEDTSLIDDQINALDSEIKTQETDLGSVAFGSSAADYNKTDEPQPFNAEQEVLSLLEPFILIAKEATEESREIEESRQRIKRLEARAEIVTDALARIEPLAERLDTLEPKVAAFLVSNAEVWQQRAEETQDLIDAARSELAAQERAKAAAARSPGEILIEVMSDRGISLVYGVGAGLVVFLAFSILAWIVRAIWRRGSSLTVMSFPVRALLLLLNLFGAVGALGAAMFIFERRDDWILLGIALLIVIGVGWILVRSVGSVLEQSRILLNLGSVQEGERLLWNGVPYQVASLNFYSRLNNPSLEGGMLEMPVQMLIGHLSRPQPPNEPWFPTLPGDWIRIDGEKLARVERQTPESVYVRYLGGAQQAIPTPSFLEAQIENLADGLRIEFSFGVDYAHQEEATSTMASEMLGAVKAALPAIVDMKLVKRVDVEFQAAAASSLDFEVEIDLAGAALGDDADIIDTIQHGATRALVDLCTQREWSIPFNQLTIHQAAGANGRSGRGIFG